MLNPLLESPEHKQIFTNREKPILRLSDKNFTAGLQQTPRKSKESGDLTSTLLFLQVAQEPDSPELGGKRGSHGKKAPGPGDPELEGSHQTSEEEDEDLTGKLLFLQFADPTSDSPNLESEVSPKESPTKQDFDALFNYAAPSQHASNLISEFTGTDHHSLFVNSNRKQAKTGESNAEKAYRFAQRTAGEDRDPDEMNYDDQSIDD